MSKPSTLHQININQGNIGDHATLVQIYAPGHAPLTPELFLHAHDAPPFSSEWLLFNQQQVPLVGREQELAALDGFLSAEGGFRWWGMHGPAGVGKSRLALELSKRNEQCWDGGFVSTYQQAVGAMNNWMPSRDTLWVMDYASSSSPDRKLVDVLSGMASRLYQCPHRVRVLLLDRTAGPEAAWWQSLFGQAGHDAPLLRATLFGQPLRLPPVDAQSHTLLAGFLVAAGWPEDKARTEADKIGMTDLMKITDGGRPLLIAMVAAALWHDLSASDTARLMPDDLLDLWLDRELRLMREGSDDARHSGLCRLLSVTTLSGGLPWRELPAQLPDGVDAAEAAEAVKEYNEWALETAAKASDFPDVYQGLLRLERLGLSRANRWALRPDALGERFLHHMIAQPIGNPALGGAQSVATQPQLSLLLYKTRGLGVGHVEVLSRMDDRDVTRALSLMARHPEAEMINVLRQMRFIARVRQSALAPRYLEVLAATFWGERHDKTIEDVARSLMALSRATDGDDPCLSSAIDRLTAVAQTSEGVALLLWLVPFMTAIADLKDVALQAVFDWIVASNGVESASTARSVILTLEVFDRVLTQIWPQLRDTNGFTDPTVFDNPRFSPRLADSIAEVYRRCFQAAARLAPNLDTDDLKEMAQCLASSAVNASYLLLAGTAAPLSARQRWLEGAAVIARNGMHWAKVAKQKKMLFTCVRNSLGAHDLLDADGSGSAQMRLKLIDSCAENGDDAEAVILLSEGLRSAAFRKDVGSMRPMVDAMIRYKDILGANVNALGLCNGAFAQTLDELLEAGRVDDAIEAVRLYSRLTLALPAGVEDGTLGMLAEQVTVHAFDQNRADLLRNLADVIEDILAVGGQGALGCDDAAMRAAISIQGVALNRAESIPWRRLSVVQVAPSDPRVDKAVRLEPAARLAHWVSFTWENDLQGSWLAALVPQAN
jgi:hypothetical protein